VSEGERERGGGGRRREQKRERERDTEREREIETERKRETGKENERGGESEREREKERTVDIKPLLYRVEGRVDCSPECTASLNVQCVRMCGERARAQTQRRKILKLD
jgi:hypothetical protein